MSRIQSILEDVLARRKQLTETASFHFLREYAPDEKEELDRLEEHVRKDKERELMAKSSQPKNIHIRLTRYGLDAILHDRRPTTIEEVEWLLTHGGDHGLQISEVEELELRNVAARLLANHHLAETRM